MNKKKLFLFLGSLVVILFIIIIGSYYLFKEKYNIETVKVEKIDEYGNAYLSNGEIVQFRGIFLCSNGSEYYWENIKELEGKTLKIEFRVNEEGYKKVEKFYIGNVVCEKTKGYGRGGYYE
jgi:hypothetical protein